MRRIAVRAPLGLIALALFAVLTPSRAPAVPAPARTARCHVEFDRLETGDLENAARDVPVRFSVTCPQGVAWRLEALPTDAACTGTFALDYGGVAVRLQLFTPGGAPWCDGTNGTAAPAGIGTGVAQTFFARAYVLPPRAVPIAAGRHEAAIMFQLATQ